MISDAELTALYGNGLRPDTAARLIDDLRAARAELDALASKAVRIFERSAEPDPLLDENRDLRARLAAVEAERDRERRWKWEERDRAEAAEADARDLVWYKASVRELEARLAAVLALCDGADQYHLAAIASVLVRRAAEGTDRG